MADEVHVHVHIDTDGHLVEIRDRLDAIDQKLAVQVAQEAQQVADLSAIQTSVARNADAASSAESLLTQLSQLIRDNATDVAALNDLAAQLDSQAADLAASVLENTPAAPEPPGNGGAEPPPDQPPPDVPPPDVPPTDEAPPA